MHKKKKSVWKKILWLIRPYLHFLMLSFVFAGISALLTLYAPILIGNAVDLIIGKVAQELALRSRRLVRVLGRYALATDGYRTYFLEAGEYPQVIQVD